MIVKKSHSIDELDFIKIDWKMYNIDKTIDKLIRLIKQLLKNW